jgi:hypothetical protein
MDFSITTLHANQFRKHSATGHVSPVVRQNEIVSSHEVKSRANLSRPVVVAAQWVNQHEIMLGFEAVQERSLPDPWNQLDYPSVQPAISPPMERTIRSSRSSLPLPFSCGYRNLRPS